MTRALVREKQQAIELRKKGLSYNEILEKLPVAKSSLSLWLKAAPLTESEKHALKDRKHANISRGRMRAAATHTENRLKREQSYLKEAQAQFQEHKSDPFFHVGIALYWAEGTKRSTQFQFTNSDVAMIKVMLLWIHKYHSVTWNDLSLRLYIHKPYADKNYERFWSEKTGIDLAKFKKSVYKPTQLGIKKRPGYMGCVRIEVPRGLSLLRKMQFWQNMLVEYSSKE